MLSPARWCLRNVRFSSSTVSAPRRPAQNLSERYRALENTARGRTSHSVSPGSTSPSKAGPVPTPTTADTIAGFVIPKEPQAPADDECCMSGCAVCVYDLYEEAIATYKDSVKTLRTALSAQHIPETEWPARIRTTRATCAVLDAFEEMERGLREKRDRRVAAEAEKRARGDSLAGDGEQVGLLEAYEGIKWILFPNR